MNKKMKIAKKLDIYNIMPYKIKGNCIYKKDTGKKVGCSDDVEKYRKALLANVPDAKKEQIRSKFKNILREIIKKDKVIKEGTDNKKDNVSLESQLLANKGLDFTKEEIEKVKEIIKPIRPDLETPVGRGQELSFQKEKNPNNLYYVIKKLVNNSDSSKESIKYGVWYVAYSNEDDLKNPTTVYYRLSDAVNQKKDSGEPNTIEMLGKLGDLITAAVNTVNI